MNRYKFLSEKPTIENVEAREIASKFSKGQRWESKVDGSTISLLESKRAGSWMVEETSPGNFRIHNNGIKEMMESFILQFYKLNSEGHE